MSETRAGAGRLVLRYRSVLVLVVASLAVASVHKIYFLQTSPYLVSIGLPSRIAVMEQPLPILVAPI